MARGFTDEHVPQWIIGIGLLQVAVIAGQVVAMGLGRHEMTVGFIVGFVTSAPFIVILLAGGYKLGQLTLPSHRYRHILHWVVAGLVVFVLTNLAIMIAMPPDDRFMFVGWVQWSASIGAGPGFLIGYYQATAIEREIEVHRTTSQAGEIDRRRELLDYLNTLLRHEVLNTAQIIDGKAALIEQSVDDDRAAAVQDHTQTIRRQSEELTQITNDVRLLLEAAKWGSEFEPIDLPALLRDELEDLQDRHDRLVVETDFSADVSVMGDWLLRRLFSNLFSNAVVHNDSDTARLDVSVTTSTDTVTVEIEDNGPGIPNGEREHLFDHTPGTRPDHGLGLAIVDMLAERYEASVELTRTSPDGSLFTVTLPSRADGPKTAQAAFEVERTAVDLDDDPTTDPVPR